MAMSDGKNDWLLAESVERWANLYQTRVQEGNRNQSTLSGISVKPLYTPLDREDSAAAYVSTIGFPGAAPFTRGVSPGMYRERLWVMGQYSGSSTPRETNERIRSLLAKGQRGFSLALDLPTQNGLDSDHPLSHGEVGRVGVPIDTVADMIDLLDGIALDEVDQIRTTANAIGPIAIALFIVAAEAHGFTPADFRVLLQNDVLKEYLARGTYIFPPRAALKFSVDVIEYCAKNLPNWEPIEFCGYHIRDSGATAVQEVAIAMANAIEYMNAAIDRGLSIDEFAPKVFMFLSAHLDLFEEVAKFRAARRMWNTLMRDRFGAALDESKALSIFCYTLGSPQTAQEPHNNIVRIAYQALAAVLGGVQTLATSSFDEALGLPSEEAVRIALRTQQILAYETGVTRSADPLGGSYFVESLTDQFERTTWDYLHRIEARGGALEALESGWLHGEINEQAYEQQRAIDLGDRPVIGVNRFVDSVATRFGGTSSSAAIGERDQLARLAELKQRRDADRVRVSLEVLQQVAAAGENTIPALIDAVRAFATVGEICDVLTSIWGRYVDHNRTTG